MYLRAAITPAIRPVILSISSECLEEEGDVDVDVERIRTASECRSVAMGRRPAARIVSPDSGKEGGRWRKKKKKKLLLEREGGERHLRTYEVNCEMIPEGGGGVGE